jgi:tetratricopeptide (TPR) repeat protein
MRNAKLISIAMIGACMLVGAAEEAAHDAAPFVAMPDDAAGAAPPGMPSRVAPGDDEDGGQRKLRELRRRAIENYAKGGARLAEARRNLLDLISFRPYVPDYHLALALVLRSEGRTDEFFRKLNDVLDLNGPKQIVYLFMGEYFMLQGDKAKALDALGKAAENGMNVMEAVGHIPGLTLLRTDTDFVKLTLSLERFTLRSLEFPQNFRDPFLPSGLWKAAEGGVEEPGAGGVATRMDTPDKDAQAQLLTQAAAALKAIEAYLAAPQANDAPAMDQYRQLQAIMAQRDKITVPRLQREFDAIERKLSEIETRLEDLKLRYFWAAAEEKIADMRAAFEATNWTGVEELNGEVAKIVADMVKASETFKPAAERIAQVAQHWTGRARVRADFAKKDLHILGIVTSAVGAEESNFVILNNKLLREGEGFEELVVDKIERNRVTFRYQGERIGLVFRRY